MTPPRVGLLVDTDVTSPDGVDVGAFTRHVVDMGVLAEEAGFDGVFFPDRHMRATTLAPSQVVNAAAVAARTSRVDVGSYCSVLPLYNPMEFAESWAAIDQLSGGRAVVAVGAGYNEDYLRFYGVGKEGYRKRFVEAGQILRRAWSERRPWSYEGEIFTFRDVCLLPGPVREGGPPIWVAGQGPWAVRHAAGTGDGYAGDPFPITPESWRERVETVRDGAARRGAPAPEVVLMRHVYLTDDAGECDAVIEEVCLPQFRFYEAAGLLRGRLPDGVAVDMDIARDTVIVGDAERCAERLAAFTRDYEATYLILKIMRPARLTRAAELEMVTALGEKVLPEVGR
ncbi:hypothetical protein GCM10009677_61070 [Sphaerisporangium rubeum]|uniref:Alkanesulfonate monooxygenase SsuD/methylene tetrahydromethanopterin reductase-like flavin-dependent oxidoreductase (Luciferase family) n=1 Tax=Sphaerisporangium rubeum TaxID=321317 RepID=A0A7X0M6J3_9ACTN|nr:LLM class flavin-dependent oxidoreductase [Sphaerisporangium rubeum]MBB6473297.1 alkanesulfonate monooxygenase SsuD/methylene tetrahydromethanopterin reductase-like flavin-dependent oxidoreductase (luciferase family) [Sphaerisporangium rubeum]